MEKTLLSKKEVAERRGISESQVYNLEEKGYLKRVSKVGGVKYPISQINDIEEYRKENPDFKVMRKLEEENRKLTRENKHLKNVIRSQNVILYGEDND